MTSQPESRTLSRRRLGLVLLTIYCLAALGFLTVGVGALWLRSPGPAILRVFSMPSSSMAPTLEPGDYVLGLMYTWQKRKVARNDLVFHNRANGKDAVFISRIVGLPGDAVQMISGRLYINGKPVARERIPDYATTDPLGRSVSVPQFREAFPEGLGHSVIERDGDRGAFDQTDLVHAPEGHVFVMGDNRDNSSDSRNNAVGAVPISRILGFPLVVLWSRNAARFGSVPR